MGKILKKIMPASRSMSGNEFVDFNPDYSIALEYTGSPISNSMLLKVLPVDVNDIPIAKVAASPAILYNLSLPVVQPISWRNYRENNNDVGLGFRVDDSKKQVSSLKNRVCDDVSCNGFNEIRDLKDGVESSGTLGFSDSSQEHSQELSDSSDMLDTPNDCNEIEELECIDFDQLRNSIERGSMPHRFGGGFCEEDEASDGEQLECRRNFKKTGVTFCENESSNAMVTKYESFYSDEDAVRERPVPQKPPKKGMCYHCHRGNRLTMKEACLVCGAKYCFHCIRKAMGSMPEGRKCLTCIGYAVSDSRRKVLGKSSRVLRGLLKGWEVRQVMEAELSCEANQLPPKSILVNGRQLSLNELMLLRSCCNPPRNLKLGSYWYDRVSGLWGKIGHGPSQIITPNLNVGGQKMMKNSSNGNTDVMINGREVTKAERLMLRLAGVMVEGSPNFWVHADGTYLEEGMKMIKGKIWCTPWNKLCCTILFLPTPTSPNPREKLSRDTEGACYDYLEQKTLCKVLLVGNDCSGTSTIYKQARVLYDVRFSDEELQNIKFMIQGNLYRYLARLLEAREIFEEESLLERRTKQSTDPGSSDSSNEREVITEYSISKKLKVFSEWLISGMVSHNRDLLFPAATREYAPYVEELWNDAAIQATYSRKDELELPRVASYFLDRAVEIAQVDYEPSDTDIMYAEGITSYSSLASMDFSFPQRRDDDRDSAQQQDPITRYQLIRMSTKGVSENCKWLHMFEDVGIVLFCVSLTDYDEYEVDNTGALTNKMLQSKKIFETIITHPSYKNKNFLLVLNKFDLLEEKIEQVPLTQCEWFQDFNPVYSRHQNNRRGGNNIAPLAQRALHYIGVQFKRLFNSLTGRKLYVCPVTALEPDTVDSALRYAREILRWEADKLNYSSLQDISSESIENSSFSQNVVEDR
ncbi:extra-large guanine nucleotide-binding protein 1-like [Amaranthus tricolor]|uniref:extra-large guanine nucleotide-binding protein 1-like n=1 Tax=Amaranthus tricolor TaxID=29722 RepID=UPI00258B1DB8|nr:extra-large guanine nucleotide-binding protein 1-like [Amaranthus tricolor]